MGIAGIPYPVSGFLLQPQGASPVAGQVPVATGNGQATAWSPLVGLAPSGDATGATDTAHVQALINLGASTAALREGSFTLNSALAPQNGTRIIGAGYELTTVSSTASSIVSAATVTEGVEISHLTLSATGHDIFTGANCIRWDVHHCQLVQNSAGNSIWGAPSVTLFIENTFRHNLERAHGATRSVPAWSMNSAGTDLVTQNVWEKSVFFQADSDATQPYFSLACSASNALLRNNTWRDDTFEHACGGMIHLESVSGTTIQNCWSWDTPASSILLPSIKIMKNSGNSAVSAGTTIIGSGRVGDGLNTGVADIQLDSNCTGTTIQDCGAFGTAVAYVIDLASSANVTLIGLQSTVSLLNAIAGHIRLYNGAYLGNSAKLQQGAAGGLLLQVQDTTGSPTSPIVQFQSQSAGDKTLGLIVAGDTSPRMAVDSNGKMAWGPGSATQDTNLYRNGVGVLKTDGALIVGGTITSAAAAPFGSTPSAPASTVSSTLVMMGLGSTWAFTPSSSGKVLVTVIGSVTTAVAVATATYGARYGTGTAPANAAAVTGTRFGSAGDPAIKPQTAGVGVPFAFTAVLSLTAGTAYWFDLALDTNNASDAASFSNVAISILETS